MSPWWDTKYTSALSYQISILVSIRNMGNNCTSDLVKRRRVSENGENTESYRGGRLQLRSEQLHTWKICKSVIKRVGQWKHSFSSDTGLGTWWWRNKLVQKEKKMPHQNQKGRSKIQIHMLEEGCCVPWTRTCTSLFWNQRANMEGTRTWKGLEEYDGFSS